MGGEMGDRGGTNTNNDLKEGNREMGQRKGKNN